MMKTSFSKTESHTLQIFTFQTKLYLRNYEMLLSSDYAERCRFVQAHGTWVGLPSNDDMGNSEVGHNAIGKLARSQQPMILFSSQLVSFCLIKCCSI